MATLSLAGVTGDYAVLLAKPAPDGMVSIVGVLSDINEALVQALLIRMAKVRAGQKDADQALNKEASDLLGMAANADVFAKVA